MYSTAFDICYKYEFVVVSTHGLITSFNLNVDASKIVFFSVAQRTSKQRKILSSLTLFLIIALSLSLLRFTCCLRRSHVTPFYLEESEPALNSQSTKTQFCQRENFFVFCSE
uniref:(northern house mosquito) hypothetical protein n=1 Tax=Culex pipiens TaxID=7175 RepID=A0A8D8JTP6_CULPI